MSELFNSIPITGISRTITDVAGIEAAKKAGPGINIILNSAKKAFKNDSADRVFIYNPDAVALWLFQKYTARFEDVILKTNIQIPVLSVMPSVTPVNFASMYTGVTPDVHGIQKHEKPVVKTDTVFDAFLRAGRKPAIISTGTNSMSMIFRERDMDYFIYDTVGECNQKALEVVEEDKHDLIVLYNGNYDSNTHHYGPESEEALNALEENIATYSKIVSHIETHWKGHRTMVGFCPDHGCHALVGEEQVMTAAGYIKLGGHGLNIADDMNVIDFYRFI